mmetsp:Transcript_12338/g.33930  ORF Transcript_12338/g.33930 Transcript_12338/m.33930 type:complete len:485 (-) Transcript_12338:210-1664(-)
MLNTDAVTAITGDNAIWILLPLTIYLVWAVFVRDRPPAKDAPVRCSDGIRQTVKMMASPSSPQWHLDLRESLGSSVFQHDIPVPGGIYVVGAAKDQREILLDKNSDKPMSMYSVFDNITGHASAFSRTTKDPHWKQLRKAASYSFSSSEINRMNDICTKYAKEWESNFLEKLAGTNATFDPSIELPKVVFRSIMEAAFEYESTDEEFFMFTSNLKVSAHEFTFCQALNPFRRAFSWMIPEVWAAHRCSAVLHKMAKKILKSYRANPSKSERNTVIKAIESGAHDLSEKAKISEIILFLVAGFDTTGYTLSNTLVLLAQHPKEMDELQQSLLHGDAVQSADHMKRVIAESKRLVPVAAMGPVRMLDRDFIFMDEDSHRNVKVPKGATVFLPHIMSHRDEKVFHDAQQFKPSRWENPTDEMLKSILTFSLGIRKCPGQSLASAEMYSVLPSILSKYEFEVAEEGKLEFFLTFKYSGAKLLVKRAKA